MPSFELLSGIYVELEIQVATILPFLKLNFLQKINKIDKCF